MGMGMGGGMMGFGLLMMLFGFLALVGIVAITIWAIVRAADGAGRWQGSRQPQARQILDERYARGEIDQDEYQRVRRDLA